MNEQFFCEQIWFFVHFCSEDQASFPEQCAHVKENKTLLTKSSYIMKLKSLRGENFRGKLSNENYQVIELLLQRQFEQLIAVTLPIFFHGLSFC